MASQGLESLPESDIFTPHITHTCEHLAMETAGGQSNFNRDLDGRLSVYVSTLNKKAAYCCMTDARQHVRLMKEQNENGSEIPLENPVMSSPVKKEEVIAETCCHS